MRILEDQEIVALYWNRSEKAVEESEHKYGRYCYSIAYGILNSREDTEECVNDTWMRAWNAIPPDRPDKLSLFLGKISRNLAFDKIKAITAKKRGGGETMLILDELEECIPAAAGTEQEADYRELGRIINRFLQTLPERECNIFLARYWYGKPLKMISHQLAIKENNIKASLYRSRAKLKSYLEKEGIWI